jgi:hypothetical protein
MNNIKVSDEHLKTIQKALELYMRCSIGQFERIVDVPSVQKRLWNLEDRFDASYLETLLKAAHKAYTGTPNGGPGIHNKEKVTDDARDAMNIHDQIRHHLWKKTGEEGIGMFVYEYDAIVKLIEIE